MSDLSEWGKDLKKDEIHLKTNLGQGQYGKIYVGHCRGTEVAVKVPIRQRLSAAEVAGFRTEIEIMRKISHPNLCLFMGAVLEEQNIIIVTELLKGDVEKEIHNPDSSATLVERLQWAKDAAQGLAWLHGNKPTVIHRDFKPSNLLIDKSGTVKVTDFGLSDLLLKEQETVTELRPKGSPLYMAPEVLGLKKITTKADVHSFGISLWELVKKQPVFSHHRDYKKFSAAVIAGERPPTEGLHPALAGFLKRCWHPNPDERPTCEEITVLLDNVMLEVSVNDAQAREFWKKHFPGHIRANWKGFLNALFQETGRQPAFLSIGQELANKVAERELQLASPFQRKEYASRGFDQFRTVYTLNPNYLDDHDFFLTSLRLLFIPNNSSNEVKLEDFGSLLGLVGPFGPEMIDRIKNLINEPWFHGNISSNEAETMLRNEPAGTYLVRFSANSPDNYVISSITKPTANKKINVNHWKVLHTAGKGFTFQNKVFPTFQKILEDYAKPANLSTPCPGSIFERLKTPNNPYGYDDSLLLVQNQVNDLALS
eukprot:TRINITY_DN1504_c0_g1_i1.p1 TRINITY_DN1504_c0_g1~~TRINITY_DN1504_c0_g1_i1.p1  ORF type:complete len:548 (+),score=107.96 TRINITY_DN1504_c0_g1_i1:25-1644(+)